MTTAKLVTSPGKGHGLTDAITDPIYRKMARKESAGQIVAVVILNPKTIGGTHTADGWHEHVSFEMFRCEPVLDVDQANELRYLLQALYEQRTSTGEQRMLPIALGKEDEKRLALIERVEEWAEERGFTGAQLESLWRENFGAGTDDDWSFGDQGVPGDYRKASAAHLLSFSYSQGVLSMETPLPHEDREDEPDDEGDDASADDGASTNATSDEVDRDVVGVACQVCRKPSPQLYDGLCPNCAKTAGIPAAAAFSSASETA